MVFHPPVQIVAKAGDAGKYKVGLPWWNMIMRGFMSGAYIAMGAGLATVCGTGVADFLGPGFAALIRGAVFPVGLIITILTGAELFTGDAMLAPMAAFIHKISWAQVLNLWVWVYVGNFIGSIVYAYLMVYGPYTSWDASGTATVGAFGTTAVAIAWGKVNYAGGMAMWSLFLKAVGCNWLVNLAVLLGICADDAVGKFFGIWFPIMAFVASGLEHSIANMFFIPAGIMTKGLMTPDQLAVHASKVVDLNWVTMWTNNVILVTIGNIVGGLLFVGIIYWVAFRKEIAALK
ncbi:formate transporter [Methanocalculus chunghsingensis]|uniref:Formate transporter n=1 Tax=Methanocalculus chunghsingensis TaxID=156457 RepID=A0A8J7WC03_9EURY|nr:formate/nitrite transporter family protein [Methanocalculus chunghsingensis]MBR1369907.1 formate transporter [Methanocalculus chunghsingensis]